MAMDKMNTFIEMNMYGDQGHGGNQGHEYVQISGEDEGDGDVFNQIKSQRTKQQREHLEKNQSNLLFNIKNFFGMGSVSKASARLTMDQVKLSYYERPVGVPLDCTLDDFFRDFYEHFYHKGFNAILASEVCNLATLFFTVIFSTFLLLCVDYIGLMECTSQDCKELPHYISTSVVKQLWRWDPPNLYSAIIAGYFVLFMAYWMFSVVGFFPRVKKAHRMKQMYNDALGITTRDIQTIRWDNVVNRFIAMQKKNGLQNTLTAHHIASRILRKENYMIALINKNILDLSLPLPFLRERIMLTKGLEFNLNACIFWGMFSPDDSIRKEFLDHPRNLRFRFMMAGFLNLVLLPFILLFMVAHFFLKHVQEWRVMQSYLGPRQWTPYALWQFREFNELPHVFERRMALSYTPASDYQKQFPSPVVAVFARAVSFISGSFVGALVIITLVDGDEGALLHVKYWDKNLLWYLTIMTGIYAVSRSLVSSPSTQDEVYDPEEAMYRLAAHTHYFPAEWRQQCHTYDSLDKFLKLFQFKAVIFAQELLSTIFTPLILCFSLPSSADAVVEFLRDYTTSVDGLGEVCSYSRFDLSKYGNNNYTGKNPSSTLQPTAQGKMEKSLLSFQEQHPKWFPQDGDSIHFQEKIQNFAMCQSQIQLGLDPSLNASQDRAHVSMSRSVRFEETTDPSNQEGHQGNDERLIGVSQSMDMSALQGSEWNSRMGGLSRMGSNSMLQSNIAGSQFYWLEKYMTQKREDTIKEE